MTKRSRLSRQRGAVLVIIATAVVVLVAAAVAYWLLQCPCERTAGAWLRGERVTEPVRDWSFANAVGLCQIEVRTRPIPHSINLNCMATADGDLYLSCASCDGKRWSTAVLADPRARLRLGTRVYPVQVAHVTDPAVKDRAWQARIDKIHQLRGGDPNAPPAMPRPDDDAWWTFRVESAAGS